MIAVYSCAGTWSSYLKVSRQSAGAAALSTCAAELLPSCCLARYKIHHVFSHCIRIVIVPCMNRTQYIFFCLLPGGTTDRPMGSSTITSSTMGCLRMATTGTDGQPSLTLRKYHSHGILTPSPHLVGCIAFGHPPRE